MIRKGLLGLFVSMLLSVAWANEKHVHGQGQLNVVLDNKTIELSLTVPLDSVVGFERKPKNETEKSALAKAEATLKNADALWSFPEAAGCKSVRTTLEAAKFEGEHADFDAIYVFECANMAALNRLDSKAFEQFKRLKRLDLQLSGPKGQRSGRMTTNRPRFSF